MTDIRLTPEQIDFFHTFGYIGLPGLMKDRIAEITDAYTEVFTKNGGGHFGKPHDGKTRSCIIPFPDKHPVLAGLLDDPKIHGAAVSLLGDDFNYMASDGNYYAGDTGWHSDGWSNHPLFIKIAFYLDPLVKENGCLRVIPGSHIPGDKFSETLSRNVHFTGDSLGMKPQDIPCVALESNPGDVLIFNHALKHAAFGGSGWRRMFVLNLCERFPDDRIDELKKYMSNWSRFWMESAYEDLMIKTATPQRMRHLEQLMANDGHLAELTQKKRAVMAEPDRG